MRVDLSDLDRLEGIGEALGRLFWCLMVVAFFAALLGSPGTALFVLILGAGAFVGRAGIEDFLRSRRAPATGDSNHPVFEEPVLEDEPEFTVYRSGRRRLRLH